MSEGPTAASKLYLQNPPRAPSQNEVTPDCPWIDAQELEDLAVRYPMLPRSRVELVLQAYWPVKSDVEAALLGLAANQERATGESLDFTTAPSQSAAL